MDIALDRRSEDGILKAVYRLSVVVVLHSIIVDGMCVQNLGLCQTRGDIGRKAAIEHDKELCGIG